VTDVGDVGEDVREDVGEDVGRVLAKSRCAGVLSHSTGCLGARMTTSPWAFGRLVTRGGRLGMVSGGWIAQPSASSSRASNGNSNKG